MGSTPKKVCVTGASGFIASHIVAQLLQKGYEVHGTVRTLDDESKTQHLRSLPGAESRLKLFATGNLGDPVTGPGSFDQAVSGCYAVCHVACPLAPKGSDEDGETVIYKPALAGTEEILKAVSKAGTVQVFVLTSSMSAVAPQPEPPIKSEEHWSDPDAQKARGNWYGAAKTMQEKLVMAHMKGYEQTRGKEPFRYAAVCPTAVFGPMLQPNINFTMNWVKGLYTGSKDKAPNDSMSFIDVRDTAAHHVACIEQDTAKGRFISVVESCHWNDIMKMLKEIRPTMPAVAPCDGEPVRPTQFDSTKMDSLGVKVLSVREILKSAHDEFVAKGLLTP
uniref:Flavanone 4-reductase n=1 Tax=Pyramimonas obovata TaxID=1411642 RepID=A0A7S0RBV1_9CHLO|mmetsp:Transcript_30630/g.66851  ORF Transcript_30630/g.66851 Transcript_30630/m.66851 type:complete len:334 (+) Transcript_30630:73-1074(+)